MEISGILMQRVDLLMPPKIGLRKIILVHVLLNEVCN